VKKRAPPADRIISFHDLIGGGVRYFRITRRIIYIYIRSRAYYTLHITYYILYARAGGEYDFFVVVVESVCNNIIIIVHNKETLPTE